MVRKIYIYTTEEAKNLSSKLKLQPKDEIRQQGKPVSVSNGDTSTEDRSSNVGSGC